MRPTVPFLLVLALAPLIACAPDAGDPPAHDETAEGQAEESATRHEGEEGVHVSLAGLTGIAFAEVGAPVEEGAWHAAEAVADEATRSLVAAPVGGIVRTLLVPPGRDVAAGTPLVELLSTELASLKADWLGARARLEQATAEVAREERLARAGAGAARELEAARTDLAVADAELEAARLALEARGVEPASAGARLLLRARRAGRVAAWSVLEGAVVEAGRELCTFDAGRAALVRVELALPGAPAWLPGAVARVRRADGAEWLARVEGVPSSLEPETRRLAYRLRIEPGAAVTEALPLAGTPLEVRVPLPEGIVLPQAALQQIEGAWGVFVVEGEEAAFRPVRRGPELGGDVLVLEGVAPGDRVATAGAYLLKALHLKRAGGGDAHAH